MGIFTAIVSAIQSLLGMSQFTDSVHSLMNEMGASNATGIYDAAAGTATELLKAGSGIASAISEVATTHNMPEHHAAVVVASAQAHLNQSAQPQS